MPVMSTAPALAHTPEDIAHRHLAQWASALCEARRALSLDAAAGDAANVLQTALDATGTRFEAATWLEGIASAGDLDGAVEALRRAVARGWLVLVVVPNTRHLATPGVTHAFAFEDARRLADQIGGEVVATQHLTEGSLIAPDRAPEGAGTVDAEVHTGAVADGDDAHAWLLAANVTTPRASSAPVEVRATLTLAPVHRAYTSRLEQANAKLWRSNNRLARESLGQHDSAAAAVVGRLNAQAREAELQNRAAEFRHREAEARVAGLEAEVASLRHRLEIEIEVGRRNDEYFQAARAKLLEPHHRLVEGVVARTTRVRRVTRRGRFVS